MPRRVHRTTPRQWLTAGALFLAIIWLGIANWNIFKKEEIARHAAADTKAQLGVLTDRADMLQGNLHDLSTERGKEAVLRQTYGVAKPGEEVVVVVPTEQATSTPPAPWYKRVSNWFGF